MGYKMKGTTLYGKPTKGDLKVSRTGNENKDDGRAKSSAFQNTTETDKKKMTAAEMEAASLAAAEKSEGVTVSGGKKTKPGTFVQYPSEGGGESRGASIAGSSKRHTQLRNMKKDKSYKMTASERAELRDLDVKTGKAYFASKS